MKNITNSTHFKQGSLKTKVAIATAIIGITLVSVGGLNNTDYNNSMDKYVQVLGSVYTTQYGVTTASILSVRSGAGTNYSILGSIQSGTKIIITGKTNNFYKITHNGKTGYINAQYVKITAKPIVVVKPPVVVYASQYGVTTTSNLSVRSGAGTNYSILGSIQSGTKIIMTGKTNNFYKITYNGKTGYISAQYVKITAKPIVVIKPPVVVYASQYGVTTTSNLSVRSGAGTNYSIFGSIQSGTKVIITGKTNNFYKITYNGKIGFVSAQYVKITAKPLTI